MSDATKENAYQGFEQGPIRPPSEAGSLLVRVTRNCHWNRCAFCPVYKGTRFSIRPVEHVLRDLDAIAAHIQALTLLSSGGLLFEEDVREAMGRLPADEIDPFRAALSWFLSGMETVFLQDADCLVLRPGKLEIILNHLNTLFPTVKRITAYSRSDTVDRMADADLRGLREAGLDRIHIGMESGSDQVLKMVCKGVTKEIHIRAGLKVKEAGMELSEYYMPGLGGVELSREHAMETADALNLINPHFIRLRTLALSERAPLAEECRAGRFSMCSDVMAVEEILLFLQTLRGITSRIVSDHMLNLLPEVEGCFPDDAERMISLVRQFLALDRETRSLFQLGRRLGVFTRLQDLHDEAALKEIRAMAERWSLTDDTFDDFIESLRKKMI